MTNLNKTIKSTDSTAHSKLLSLLEVFALELGEVQVSSTNAYTQVSAGKASLLNQINVATTFTETRQTRGNKVKLAADLASLSLADLAPLLGLNPGYELLYGLLEFSDVHLEATAFDQHDWEELTISGTVPAANQESWKFLELEVGNPLPLKDLTLAVNVRHQSGSFRKRYRVTVTGKLTLSGQDLTVELSLPIGNTGTWSLRLLPPGVNFNLTGLAQLAMGSNAFNDLPTQIKNLPDFDLQHLEIHFDPSAKKVYDLSFGLQTTGAWNILPDDGSVLALKQLGLELVIRQNGNGGYSYQGQVKGAAHVGSFDIEATIPLPLRGAVTLQTQSTQALPSLGAFTDLLGGTALTSLLPEGLSSSFSSNLKNLRLVIDLDKKQLHEFDLSLSAATPWPIWENHLEIQELDLQVLLQRSSNGWQTSGSLQGKGTLEEVALALRIDKPINNPWQITLLEPISFGLDGVKNLTEVDLTSDGNNTLPSALKNDNAVGVTLREFELQVQKDSPKIPYLAVYIESQGRLEIIPGLSLQEVACVLQIENPLDNATRKTTGQIGGTIQIGEHPLRLVSTKNDQNSGWTYQGSTDLGDDISLTSLLQTLFSGLGVNLPDNLPELTVRNLELTYSPTAKTMAFKGASTLKISEQLEGDFTINVDHAPDKFTFEGAGAIRVGGAAFELNTQYDSQQPNEWAFSAQTVGAVELAQLLREMLEAVYLPAPEVLPVNLMVENALLETKPRLKYYHLAGDVALNAKIAQFSLDLRVALELTHPAQASNQSVATKAWQVVLEAASELDIAGVGVQLKGNYQTGQGWILSGSTAPNQVIPIGTLMADIAQKFGVSSDQLSILNGIEFKNLKADLNTGSRNYAFGGEVDFAIASGKTVSLRPHIALTRQQGNAYKKEFAGHLEIPLGDQTLKFDLIFDKSNTNSLMLAAYHNDNPADISLSELLEKVGIGGVPDVLKIRLREAALAHQKTSIGGNNETTQNLFTAQVDGGLNLSALPLVGKMFPVGESITLQVQLLMASAGFSQANLGEINALLPEGISHLQTEQDITQGTHLEAKLQVADDLFHLDLPVAVNENPEEPNPNGSNLPPEPLKTTADSTDDGTKWFALQKNLGPVHFHRIGLGYGGGKIKAALDASFALGGLTISLDGLSVSSPLTKFSPSFDLKGLGIDYHNDALEIGGAFLRETVDGEDEYDGTAILKMEEFSLGAIGSYTKQEGHPSLFIFATLDAPLGGPPFFFVKGLSAGFGYNRALRMPTSADKVLDFPLVAEAMQGQAGNTSPNLSDELEKIHLYIPPAIGQMFLAVGVNFSSFELIESSMLLAASFGNRFELDLLGVSTLVTPPAEAGGNEEALAVVQMALKGAFIPDEGFVGLMGVLTPQSYVLSKDCHLTGGFAAYSWLKGEHAGDFVMTVGGYHPAFAKPAHYPSVPRVGFNWALDSHTSIKGDMYYALCAHALMAGGHLEAMYHNGNLRAWFKMGADFLISWKPYHYDISLYIDIGASYTYHFFGTHHITVDLGADVHIWGPKFAGHARIHIWIVSIGVSFGSSSGKTLQPIDWDNFKKGFLPKEDDKYLSVNVKDGLVSKGKDDTHLGAINPKHFAIVTDGVIPAKEVTWGSQSVPKTWNTAFGIAPMDKAADKVSSSQTIKLTREGGDYTQNLKYKPVTKKVPAAMWGQKLQHNLNDARFVDNAFAGLEITAKESTPGHSQLVDRDFVKYETTALGGAIGWETRNPFTKNVGDAEAKEKINNSIVVAKSEGEDKKNKNADILNALGLGNATVDLNDKVADHFVLAPQVEEVPQVTPA
ncbi:DUF6603 domain-containing protein [Microscilla marina]|uniref:Putative transcriptional activator srcap-like protein n=1 Tax=Microscilla marina ATCC 23134 TaxID=313606 RepID=A1ZRJ7_MICM2|nr:DUF6603 domain-containing protein [Microscilla marina]EAY26902.1 putative transcriptional activator srcap-like protein [Microscilla marina ATCC 23134]